MQDFKHGLDYMLNSNDPERQSAVPRLDLIGGFDENAFRKEFESAFPELAAKLDYAVVACNFGSNKSNPFLYFTMGIELKETGAETFNYEIIKWLERIYEEKRREVQEFVIKKLAKDNGFDEKTRIPDTNEFEKPMNNGEIQTIKIDVSSGHSEEDETLGLDLKKLGIGSYKVDTYYLDKKFYFCMQRSTVPESALKRVLKIIFWVPKKIFDLVRNIFVPKKRDDENNKEKPVTDREKHVMPKPKEISNKRHRFPEMEENKTDMVI